MRRDYRSPPSDFGNSAQFLETLTAEPGDLGDHGCFCSIEPRKRSSNRSVDLVPVNVDIITYCGVNDVFVRAAEKVSRVRNALMSFSVDFDGAELWQRGEPLVGMVME